MALLIPYVQAPRPLGRWPAFVAPLLVLVMVLGRAAPVVELLAETLAMLALAPVAFDVVDRAILAPWTRTVRPLRAAWFGFFVAFPVLVSAAVARGPAGTLGELFDYGARTYEAFLAVLLVEVFFALRLGGPHLRGCRNEQVTAAANQRRVNAV